MEKIKIFFEKILRGVEGDELFPTRKAISHRRDVTDLSLVYFYVYDKGSDKLHSAALIFAARSEHATYTLRKKGKNHSSCDYVQKITRIKEDTIVVIGKSYCLSLLYKEAVIWEEGLRVKHIS